MPGESYSKEEIGAMNGEEFAAARSRGFVKPSADASPLLDLSALEQPKAKDPNAWSNRKSLTKDFTCPSGQTCRLRPLSPEKLLQAGLLDQITRLEGLADALVQKAEGNPPVAPKLPSREDFAELLKVINLIVPLAVESPHIWGDDEDAPGDAIRISDIDLEDRIAIMEEALKGLRLLDRFHHPR